MSGNSFKCGLHRFDGHGSSSYRPKDPSCSQVPSQLASLKAERDRQDSIWSGQQPSQQPSQQSYKPPERTLPKIQPDSTKTTYESRPPWLVQQTGK